MRSAASASAGIRDLNGQLAAAEHAMRSAAGAGAGCGEAAAVHERAMFGHPSTTFTDSRTHS